VLGQAASGLTTIDSSAVNIGTTSTGVINLGNTGTSGANVLNIGRGATGINIGTGSTGAVTIGNANGVTKLNGPLTLGSAPTSSTHIGYTLTTSLTSATSITAGNLPTFDGIKIPSPGIWLISYTIRLTAPNNNGSVGRFFTNISSPSTGYTTISLAVSENSGIQSVNNNTSASNTGSAVLNVTNSTTYISIYVVLGVIAGPITTNNPDSYMQFTRIG
jgi:uncharacterized membrane protein